MPFLSNKKTLPLFKGESHEVGRGIKIHHSVKKTIMR